MREIIQHLSRLCDEIIIKEMNKLKALGKAAKDMTALGDEEKDIMESHKQMAIVFDELKPFEQRVRYLYPELNELFNLLDKCIVGPKND